MSAVHARRIAIIHPRLIDRLHSPIESCGCSLRVFDKLKDVELVASDAITKVLVFIIILIHLLKVVLQLARMESLKLTRHPVVHGHELRHFALIILTSICSSDDREI